MGRMIGQTVYEALEPGTYRARLASAMIEASEYSDSGEQVAMRWDLVEPGLETKSIRAWANPKLSGGKKPSKLYTWVSGLMFGGKPLPEGWELDLDDLINREAILVVDVKPDTGYNRIVQVLPLRTARAAGAAATLPATDRAVLQPRPPLTAASAAGIPSGGVPVNTMTLPGPDEVPEWLLADDAGMPF